MWPDETEVVSLWRDSGFADEDQEVAGYLVGRAIDPKLVAHRELARVLRTGQALPRWARYRGQAAEAFSWYESGHRLIVPTYGPDGKLHGVRAWRVRDGDTPKRLPPSGHKAQGLVLANDGAVRMLRSDRSPVTLVVVEGESDHLTWCTRTMLPVLGVMSGSWNAEFAAKVPAGSSVLLRIDTDEAGDRYAKCVADSLKEKCEVRRMIG